VGMMHMGGGRRGEDHEASARELSIKTTMSDDGFTPLTEGAITVVPEEKKR
jgi:hypothetical protein